MTDPSAHHEDSSTALKASTLAPLRWRPFVVIIPLLIIFVFLGTRMATIQVVQHKKWTDASKRQRTNFKKSPGERGPIQTISNDLLAYSAPTFIVTADLRNIKDPQATADQLADLLKKPAATLKRRLSNPNVRVTYLARDINPEVVQEIRDLKIKGIAFEDSYRRIYPRNGLASHIIGQAGIDGGLEGIELSLDSLLRGVSGYRTFERDASRRAISRMNGQHQTKNAELPQRGMTITLTIHAGIQHAVEEELNKILKKFKPKSATAIVMDVQSGAILAMAGVPSFNLNKPNLASMGDRRNRALSDCYEPGSTFKTFIAAMALEKRLFHRNSRFFCENGSWRRGYRTLHDAHAYGWLTFDEVIIKSSNIGAAKQGMRLGKRGVYDTVKAFGFGERTGLDLPGEGYGIVRAFRKWTKDSLLSVPMGQEIATTPIQLVTAYTAMLNGGVFLRPQIVDSIKGRHDEILFKMRAHPVRRVISTESSKAMREILHATVIKGTGRRAWCAEYPIGGKTGTAQKVIDGRYSHSKYVGSFCGFAPAHHPKLVCLIAVDEPKKSLGYYGGTVAAPGVREILRRGLNTLGVRPRSRQAQEQAKKNFDRRGG